MFSSLEVNPLQVAGLFNLKQIDQQIITAIDYRLWTVNEALVVLLPGSECYMEQKRLNKFISDTGFCSRREADTLIEQGRVTVNGKNPEAGTKVTAQDKVRVDDQIVRMHEEKTVFLVFNKPVGIATTTDLSVRNNIIQALNYPASLLPIGLLDRDAEGLMFLSNETELARKITKADTRYEKEYLVTVDKLLSADFLSKISEGGMPEPGATRKKNFVTKMGPSRFRIVLEPGTNHHVKRMVEALGYKVVHLQRTRLGSITAGKLPVGMWRTLSEAEINEIKSVVAGKASRNPDSKREITHFNTEGFPARNNNSAKPQSGSKSTARPVSRASKNGTTSARNTVNSPKATTSQPRIGKSRATSGKNAVPKSGGRRNTSPKK